MSITRPSEEKSASELSLPEITSRITENADRVAQLGQWPDYQKASAQESLASRIPTAEKKAAGFDAGMACALGLIPEEKQRLSAALHAAYTPELVAQIRKEAAAMDADSETAWWLAACHICQEDDGIDGEGFRKQILDFEKVAADPKKRKEVADEEFKRTENVYETETYGIPFGKKDGCIQAAYIHGYPVAAQYASNYGIYFIGTYEESLGLEDFPWSQEVDNEGRSKSGPVWKSRQFVKCANEDEFKRAIAVVKSKMDTSRKIPSSEEASGAIIEGEQTGKHAEIGALLPEANERYQRAKEAMLAQYPELTADLQRSFQTPQLGPHHTEGPTMESHLALIMEGFEKLAKGEVHEDITDPELKGLLVETVKANPELFTQYAFLHDIAKPDCLRLTLTDTLPNGENRVEISWDDWLEIEKNGQPYTYRKDGVEIPVKAIGYFHQSKGKEGNHGNVGANLIEQKLGEKKSPAIILTAIRMHETAFQQFADNCDVGKYEEEYGQFSEEELKFILVASYIDFVGSKTEAGKPDFSPLMNVLTSKRNAELVRRFVASGAKFPENKLNKLKQKNGLITREELEEIRQKETVFTREELETSLGPILDEASLNADERKTLFTDIMKDSLQWGKLWGGKLGRTVGTIKKILETCGTDPFHLE